MTGAGAFYNQVVGWTMAQFTPEMGVFKMGKTLEASIGPVPPNAPPKRNVPGSTTSIADGNHEQALSMVSHFFDLTWTSVPKQGKQRPDINHFCL